MDKSDEQLVAEVKNGNINSYQELILRYQKKLYWFTFRITNNHQDALDVIQNTFFQVYEHIGNIRSDQKFSSYIFESAKNNSISLIRKRKKTISIDLIGLVDTDEKLYKTVFQSEASNVVKQAIDKLPEIYQKIIKEYYYNDKSYEEISRGLKIPINTVRIRLLRAKKLLKPMLEGQV